MPEIITRKEAIKRGLKHYFTGKPCKNGHVETRHVSNAICHACHRKFAELYRLKNPEKVRKKWRSYYSRNSETIRQKKLEEYKANPQKHRAYSRKCYEMNAEAYRAYSRKFRLENLEKTRRAAREYHSKVRNLIAVLRLEDPELLKEFGL